MLRRPVDLQLDAMDCGPACLRMVLRSFGERVPLARLRELCDIGSQGVSLRSIAHAAEALGMRTLAVQLPLERCIRASTPFIAFWKQDHFIVVDRVTARRVDVRDPSHGRLSYTSDEFAAQWATSNLGDRRVGAALFLEPTARFHDAVAGERERRTHGIRSVVRYATSYRAELWRIALALGFSMVAGLVAPFLTQAIVDLGINYQDLHIVYVILAAQLALFVGKIAVELLRARLVLHVGARISIAIVSDYLFKLMRLPMSFFVVRNVGDVLQRIGDNNRIERFLTTAVLSALFSVIHLLVCGVALLLFDGKIALLFAVTTAMALAWMYAFGAKRREIDFKRFHQSADSQGKLLQILGGLSELKLAAAERQKRWEWESVQARLFRLSVSALSLEQWQELGSAALVEGKDILATILVAREVVAGRMTLGQMLAVQYLLGQTGGPLRQIVTFFKSMQNAHISLERLEEVHASADEEVADEARVTEVPRGADLVLEDVSFRYPGTRGEALVLDRITLRIPRGKVTAIVGASGSGKTTLLRLLLRFYRPTAGEILLGSLPIDQLHVEAWRRSCGAVLQGGFLFSDTIARNVALGAEQIDRQRLLEVLEIASAREFVEALPLGWNTKVGNEGQSLSEGQRQRLLIARALYADPRFLFFDEATSSLDASNERKIHDNLARVFEGHTVLVIAHRLSTVQNADQIVVLDRGRVVEVGSHDELSRRRGAYFKLVKNQLELGS